MAGFVDGELVLRRSGPVCTPVLHHQRCHPAESRALVPAHARARTSSVAHAGWRGPDARCARRMMPPAFHRHGAWRRRWSISGVGHHGSRILNGSRLWERCGLDPTPIMRHVAARPARLTPLFLLHLRRWTSPARIAPGPSDRRRPVDPAHRTSSATRSNPSTSHADQCASPSPGRPHVSRRDRGRARPHGRRCSAAGSPPPRPPPWRDATACRPPGASSLPSQATRRCANPPMNCAGHDGASATCPKSPNPA